MPFPLSPMTSVIGENFGWIAEFESAPSFSGLFLFLVMFLFSIAEFSFSPSFSSCYDFCFLILLVVLLFGTD